MPKVAFPYKASRVDAMEGESARWVYRPERQAVIATQDHVSTRMNVLLDTGADMCLFPLFVARTLRLDVESLPRRLTKGLGSEIHTTYYATVAISLGSGVAFVTRAGFTAGLEGGFGLLGQLGFFESFNVEFRYAERRFLVETKNA